MNTHTTDWKLESMQTKQELSQTKEAVYGKWKDLCDLELQF